MPGAPRVHMTGILNRNYRFAVPLLTGFLTFIAFEIVYFNPKLIVWVGALLSAVFAASVQYICAGKGGLRARPFSLFAMVFLGWSGFAFSLFVELNFLRHFLAVLVAIFIVLLEEGILAQAWSEEIYKGYALENLTAYALTFTVFLAGSALLGFSVLTSVGYRASAGIFAAVIFGVHWAVFRPNTPAVRRALLFTGILTFIVCEFFLVFALLPLHFMIGGASITVLWYVGVIMSRARLSGVLTRKMAYRHVLLGAALLIVLFASARWQ